MLGPNHPSVKSNTHQPSGGSRKQAVDNGGVSLATSPFNRYCYAISSSEHFLAELFDRLQAAVGDSYRLIEELGGDA